MLFTAGTLTFFLLITLPRGASRPTSHGQLETFIAIALIALIPLGTLMYHLAARRSEDASGREVK
jgi:hypothetical protein